MSGSVSEILCATARTGRPVSPSDVRASENAVRVKADTTRIRRLTLYFAFAASVLDV